MLIVNDDDDDNAGNGDGTCTANGMKGGPHFYISVSCAKSCIFSLT